MVTAERAEEIAAGQPNRIGRDEFEFFAQVNEVSIDWCF